MIYDPHFLAPFISRTPSAKSQRHVSSAASFLEHQALATQWLTLKGRRVTDSAVVRVMRDLSARDLRVVLAAYAEQP